MGRASAKSIDFAELRKTRMTPYVTKIRWLLLFPWVSLGCADQIYGTADNEYDDVAFCNEALSSGSTPDVCVAWCRAEAAKGTVTAACAAVACVGDQSRCDGNTVQKCRGSTWTIAASCGATEYCNPDSYTCEQACLDMTCGSDHGIECGTCSSSQFCDESTQRCRDPVTYPICESGLSLPSEACAACLAGVCCSSVSTCAASQPCPSCVKKVPVPAACQAVSPAVAGVNNCINNTCTAECQPWTGNW